MAASTSAAPFMSSTSAKGWPSAATATAAAAQPSTSNKQPGAFQWDQLDNVPTKQFEYLNKVASLAVERRFPSAYANTTRKKDELSPSSEHQNSITRMDDLLAWIGSVEMESISQIRSGQTTTTTTTTITPAVDGGGVGSTDTRSAEEYMRYLEDTHVRCERIAMELSTAQKGLAAMDETFATVGRKTSELHHLCQDLLADERQLQVFADDLREKLKNFDQLETISSKLNNPNLSVEDTHFLPLLARVDECIAFIEANPTFAEAAQYLLKFKQLQGRALTLIRDYILNLLRRTSPTTAAATTITAPPASATTPTTTTSPAVAAPAAAPIRFETLVPKIKPLCHEIEERAATREFAALLADIHHGYFIQRRKILEDYVLSTLTEYIQLPDMYQMIRAGCSFLANLCHTEHELFQLFFRAPSAGLRMMFEGFFVILYDRVRPAMVHCRDFDQLCILVRILKVEILDRQILPRGDSLASFRPIIQRLLQDAQERLVFVADTYIRDEVAGFEPLAQHLDYPAILRKTSAPSTPTLTRPAASTTSPPLTVPEQDRLSPSPSPQPQQTSDDSTSTPIPTLPAVDASLVSPDGLHYTGWYPTLTRSVRFLARLYMCIDKATFDNLAQETTMFCVQTLCVASRRIERAGNKIDAALFLIKHLVILQDELSPFDIDFFRRERTLDFSHIKDLLRRVLRGELTLSSVFALSSNNAILSIIQSATPRLTMSEKDVKKDVEILLTQTMESFIVSTAQSLLERLLSYVTQSSAFIHQQRQAAQQLGSQSQSNLGSLGNQPFASPANVVSVASRTREILIHQLPILKERFSLYLGPHGATRTTLSNSIKTSLVDSIENFNALVRREYSEQDFANIPPPSPRTPTTSRVAEGNGAGVDTAASPAADQPTDPSIASSSPLIDLNQLGFGDSLLL